MTDAENPAAAPTDLATPARFLACPTRGLDECDNPGNGNCQKSQPREDKKRKEKAQHCICNVLYLSDVYYYVVLGTNTGFQATNTGGLLLSL